MLWAARTSWTVGFSLSSILHLVTVLSSPTLLQYWQDSHNCSQVCKYQAPGVWQYNSTRLAPTDRLYNWSPPNYAKSKNQACPVAFAIDNKPADRHRIGYFSHHLQVFHIIFTLFKKNKNMAGIGMCMVCGLYLAVACPGAGCTHAPLAPPLQFRKPPANSSPRSATNPAKIHIFKSFASRQ